MGKSRSWWALSASARIRNRGRRPDESMANGTSSSQDKARDSLHEPSEMDGREGSTLTRGGPSSRFSGWMEIGIAIINRAPRAENQRERKQSGYRPAVGEPRLESHLCRLGHQLGAGHPVYVERHQQGRTRRMGLVPGGQVLALRRCLPGDGARRVRSVTPARGSVAALGVVFYCSSRSRTTLLSR